MKSKSSLPCAASAKLPSGEIADSHVAHGEISDGTNLGSVDMSLTMVPASKSASRGDVLTSTPLHSPLSFLCQVVVRNTHPVTVFLSQLLVLVTENFMICQAGGPTSNFERLLVTSINALTKTVHNNMSSFDNKMASFDNKMSNFDNKLSNVENKISHFESEMSHFRSELSYFMSDLNDQRSRMDQGFSDMRSDMSHLRSELKTDMINMKSDLNEQISIVESNLHVTISDLIRNEY